MGKGQKGVKWSPERLAKWKSSRWPNGAKNKGSIRNTTIVEESKEALEPK